MVFFFMVKKPKVPKGVVTLEKLSRIIGIQINSVKRTNQIQAEFNSTSLAKRLQKKIGTSEIKANEMLAKRKLKADPRYETKIKLTLSENATSNLRYLSELRDFAVKKMLITNLSLMLTS